jgi:hypothetical protein
MLRALGNLNILDSLAKFRKASLSFVMPVRLPVRMEYLGSP